MSFSSAFKYPFNNFAKVFSIVLVLTIAFAIFLGLLLNSHDWSPLVAQLYGLDPTVYDIGTPGPISGSAAAGLLGLVVVAIVSGFWLSGYSIEVIRSVVSDIEYMPDVEFSRNLKDGFYLFLSSVVYWVILIVILVVLMFVLQAVESIGVLHLLVATVGFFFTVAAMCLMGWAYFIGMARFALEGEHRASWQIRRNLELSMANWRSGASLLVYMIFLSIIYNILRGIVDGILGGVGGLMIGVTLSVIIMYFFNLMQHFSTQHLIAQFATEIGLRSDNYDPEKRKF